MKMTHLIGSLALAAVMLVAGPVLAATVDMTTDDAVIETVAFDVDCPGVWTENGRVGLYDINVAEMDVVDDTPNMLDSYDRAVVVVNAETKLMTPRTDLIHDYQPKMSFRADLIEAGPLMTPWDKTTDLLGTDVILRADGYDDDRRTDELDTKKIDVLAAAFLDSNVSEGPPTFA